ncbi:MAG: hypothetical protein WAV15_02950 [Minisyncoccia bacterium]
MTTEADGPSPEQKFRRILCVHFKTISCFLSLKGLAIKAEEYIMDSMFRDKKDIQENLKDSSGDMGLAIKDSPNSISYTKTDKLVTALYMVTDIIDKDEPLRNKLRTLGTNIISDINDVPAGACARISEVMSFLDIAFAMNIISQMNCNILRKEFSELDQAIRESGDNGAILARGERKINLSEFFTEDESEDSHPSLLKENFSSHHGRAPRSLGVQKGGTLLKALKGIEGGVHVSDKTSHMSDRVHEHHTAEHFDVLKKQRREDILNVIKIMGGSATITDIKDKAKTLPAGIGSLSSCGEKTLQRELLSMLKDGVLKKTGEKRWSRYFVK